MNNNDIQLCADRFSDRKVGHPDRPAAQLFQELFTGDSTMKSYKCITLNGKQVRLHRTLMEAYIGRKLMPWELVHHRDGDKHNNELSNLQITIRSTHAKTHNIGEKTRFKQRYIIKQTDLIELYINQRLPIWKVGKLINAPYGSVFRALKKYNIIRKIQPCQICSSPSQSLLKDICYRCYHRKYQRMYRAKQKRV